MDIAILIFATLAFAHFIYEGIIAPSIRMKLRNRMFELRDEVRALHAEDRRCSKEAFEIAHGGINQYINRLHAVTISLMGKFREAYKDPAFRKEVERRKAALDACDCKELQSIVTRANRTIESALMTNTGMWFVYLVPVALAVVCIHAVGAKLHRFIFRLFATPLARTDSLIPA